MGKKETVQQAFDAHLQRTGVAPTHVGTAPGTWVMLGDCVDAYQGAVLVGHAPQATSVALHMRDDDRIIFHHGERVWETTLHATDHDAYAQRICGLLHTLIQRQVLSRDTTGIDITVVSEVPLGAGLGALASVDAAIVLACASSHSELSTPPFRAKLAEICSQAAQAHCTDGFIAPIRARYTAALRGEPNTLSMINYADGSLTTATHPARFHLQPIIVAPRKQAPYWHDGAAADVVRQCRQLIDAAQANFGVTSLRQLPEATQRVVQWTRARVAYGDTTAPDPAWVQQWLEFCEAETQRTLALANALRAQQLPVIIDTLRASTDQQPLQSPSALLERVLDQGALCARPAAAAVSGAVLALVAARDLERVREGLHANYDVIAL